FRQNSSPHFACTPSSPMTANLCERGATKISTPFRSGVWFMPRRMNSTCAATTGSSTWLGLMLTRIWPEVLSSASRIAATMLSWCTCFENSLGCINYQPPPAPPPPKLPPPPENPPLEKLPPPENPPPPHPPELPPLPIVQTE